MNCEQDWKPLVFNKGIVKFVHKDKLEEASLAYCLKKQNQPDNKFKQILNSDNPVAPKKLGAELGKQIQKARTEKNLTQKELGVKIAVQANIIRDYESGNVVPDRKILNKISKALGVKLIFSTKLPETD